MWITVKQLPSLFLGYNRLATMPVIQFRPYTHGEVKALSEPTLSSADKYQIAKDGIKANFPVAQLYWDDFRYIMVLRTLSTVDTQDFQVPFIDTDGSQSVQTFNLRDIEYEDIKLKSLPLKFKLQDGTFARLTLPTLEHMDRIERENLDTDVVYKYVLPEDVDALKKYVDDLAAPDAVDLERVVAEYLVLDPVVRPKLSKVNPADADEPIKEGRVVVSIDTITPFRAKARDLASRISFDA